MGRFDFWSMRLLDSRPAYLSAGLTSLRGMAIQF